MGRALPEGVPTVLEEEIVDPQMREPTVPGNFLKTTDPFGLHGQYGNASLNLKRHSYTAN
jgi:hypothetical protein